MKAIKAVYHGPTNTRGSRITASDGDGHSVTIPYPHELSGADVYAAAAVALARKMGWKGTLIAGGINNDYVFTFSESEHYPIGEAQGQRTRGPITRARRGGGLAVRRPW